MPHDARMPKMHINITSFSSFWGVGIHKALGFQFLVAFTSSDPVTRDFLVTLRTSAGNDGAAFLAGEGYSEKWMLLDMPCRYDKSSSTTVQHGSTVHPPIKDQPQTPRGWNYSGVWVLLANAFQFLHLWEEMVVRWGL